MNIISESYKRLEQIATDELNTSTGGFGGFIAADNLINSSNLTIVISSILGKYYFIAENQDEIDGFINKLINDYVKSELGAVSSAHVLNSLLDELEVMIAEFK